MALARTKILCIEEDRGTAAVVADELTGSGFEVSIAYSGEEALLRIMKATPDLVLCDTSMSTMTGLELLERLRELAPFLGRIPVVLVTALADPDTELKARRLGADDYVTKPVNFEQLICTINSTIAGAERTELTPTRPNLSDREIEVLALVARGKSSAAIAAKLGLVKRTVDFHVDNARIKLGAKTWTAAVITAVSHGLIKRR
jgi:DNA-binding NarL/FixJ family response regulator